MKRQGRVEFLRSIRAKALAFYKGQCAVCTASPPDVKLQVHHVCEDPDRPGSRRLSNAIPLCPNHHSPIQDSNHLTQPGLAGAMYPETLRNSAFDHLRRGNYEKSYACFQLAAYFFQTRYAKPFYAADCGIGCIAALRAIQSRTNADVLLADAIRDAARLTSQLRDGSAVIWKAQFFRQLELALFDYREFDLASECCRRSRKLFRAAPDYRALFPEDIELLKANAARAHILVAKTIDDELISEFAATKKTLKRLGDLRGYCTNLDVESSIEFSLRGPTKRARDLVEEALYYRERICNPWVLAQLLYREGLLRVAKDRQKHRAKTVLIESLELFTQYDITPEPQRDTIEQGPGRILRILGLGDARLIEPRRKFPLSQREIAHVMNLVAPGG